MNFYTELEETPVYEELPLRIDCVSDLNPEMNMTFWIAPEDEDEAVTLLENADAEWWAHDEIDWCHAEALESALESESIEYAVAYAEEDEDD